VFSAGVLIWETLAAKRLFKAENEAATLQRVMNDPIPSLARVAPHLSRELCAAVAFGLQRDPSKRFATAAQYADAIEAAAVSRDGIADSRDVAAFVKETLGQEIEQQREAVRAWIARSEPSQAAFAPPAPSSVSVAAMSIPEGSKSLTHGDLSGRYPPRRSKGAIAMAALLVACLAGGGGFWLARGSHPAPLPVVAAPAPPPAAPLPAAPPPTADTAPTTPVTTLDALPSAVPALTLTAAPVSAPRATAARPAAKPKKKRGDDLNVRNPYR